MSARITLSVKSADPTMIEPVPAGYVALLLGRGADDDDDDGAGVLDPLEVLLPPAGAVVLSELPLLPQPASVIDTPSTAADKK